MRIHRFSLVLTLAGFFAGCAHFRRDPMPDLAADTSSAEVQVRLNEVTTDEVVVPTELLRTLVDETEKLATQNRKLRSQLRGLKRIDLEKD